MPFSSAQGWLASVGHHRAAIADGASTGACSTGHLLVHRIPEARPCDPPTSVSCIDTLSTDMISIDAGTRRQDSACSN